MKESKPLVSELLIEMDLPNAIPTLSLAEKENLAKEIRQTLIHVAAKNGGHLAPSLGVVELTIALATVFNPARDHVVWDVGHQCYAWKLLTGRAKDFHTLRQFDGIAGYPKISESPMYDSFGVGHASTSISAALGIAMARDLKESSKSIIPAAEGNTPEISQKESSQDGGEHVIAVIGDGALTGGMAFEALNQAGGLKKKMIVILNDNEMSISDNVGALSQFLSRNLANKKYMKFKKETGELLKSIPKIGNFLYDVAEKGEKSFKAFFTPGMLFEAFDFSYIGPVDGHDFEQLERHLAMAKELSRPVLLHVRTKKGNGYPPAENNPSRFHRTPGFEPETGLVFPPPVSNQPKGPGFTKIFGSSICKLAAEDKRIVAISAAMPDGTGLGDFRTRFPDRFIDTGICEEHAVTFAAGMATRGFKPVVAIYSTFMQRAVDQVIHDVCIQNLPVVFCLDRAGIVGEDGPTHHGCFDLSFLRAIPNMHVLAPRDEADLPNVLYTALHLNAPVALRYPPFPTRSEATPSDDFKLIPLGQGEMLIEPRNTKKVCVIGVGHRLHPCREAVEQMSAEGRDGIALFDARWIRPLPEEQLRQIVSEYKNLFIVEENVKAGGFSSAILEFLNDNELIQDLNIKRIGLPDDRFVEHGSVRQLRETCGLDVNSLTDSLRDFWDKVCG